MGKTNSRLQNTLYNFTSGLMGEFIIYAMDFITRTVFIYTLGKSYLGIGGLFANILSLLSLTDMGIGTALNYRLYEPLKRKDPERLKSIMRFYQRVYRWIGWAIFLLGVCIIPFLKYLVNDYEVFAQLGINAALVFLLYLAQSVSTYWFFAYKSAIVKADQKEYYLNIIGYGCTIVTAMVQIVILLFLQSYMLYISVVIMLNILQNYMYARFSDKQYPFLKEKDVKPLASAEKKEIFKDCGAITLFSLNSVVLKATDNLVLSAFIGLEIVGLYSNYLMIYNALKKIIKKIIRSAQSSLGNLFADATCETKVSFFSLMHYIMALICGTSAVCVAVLSDEFILTWIGSEYIIPAPFSYMIALELYTIGLKLVLEQARDTLGIFQKLKWRPVASVVINIVVSVCTVQIYGIYGVLIGTLVAEWSTTFVLDPRMIYKYGFQGWKKTSHYYLLNLKYLIQLFVLARCNIFLAVHVLPGHGWASVFLHAVITGCTTLGGLLLLNFRSVEFQALKKKIYSAYAMVKLR